MYGRQIMGIRFRIWSVSRCFIHTGTGTFLRKSHFCHFNMSANHVNLCHQYLNQLLFEIFSIIPTDFDSSCSESGSVFSEKPLWHLFCKLVMRFKNLKFIDTGSLVEYGTFYNLFCVSFLIRYLSFLSIILKNWCTISYLADTKM
jgi:hypothetical protein